MTSVLVVGASGRMGSKIVHELLALGATVRVTHRASSNADQVARLAAAGAELVIADLADEPSLARACKGIDVVVSSVQGLRETIVDGQLRLLRAAEEGGVARMLPSDYALDFFKTQEGGNRNLDLRREFNHALDASRVRGTSLLCGAFMDLVAMGAIGPDVKTGVYRVWGDLDQPYDLTCTDDVARYIAAVALDAGAGRVVRVAGDTRSPRELAAICEELRGVPSKIEHAGSVEDLTHLIDRMHGADAGPPSVFPVWQQMQYGRDMASGLGRLVPLDNARYPTVAPLKTCRLMGNEASSGNSLSSWSCSRRDD
ncbi:MAG: NmrA family NAD(P)-binding protein [Proteobacteria bacterium]|nr:NmrA family NAD(P)-binding protein [Pseudomonadota bacterium]